MTFAGPELAGFGTGGLDQRIKLIFPLPDLGICDIGLDDPAALAAGAWYERWRALPDERRNPLRTFTVRAVRPAAGEIDVDFAVHGGAHGPAARWLAAAAPGAELVVIGPDERSPHRLTGIDWQPGGARTLLLAGDETAAPAISSIVESLPASARVSAYLEVEHAGDTPSIDTAAAADTWWLPRDPAAPGRNLADAVAAWIAANQDVVRAAAAPAGQDLADVDVDADLLWESPAAGDGEFYAWLAGEAAMIKSLRRLLVTEHGIDRSRVAFMGYWRRGRAEQA